MFTLRSTTCTYWPQDGAPGTKGTSWLEQLLKVSDIHEPASHVLYSPQGEFFRFRKLLRALRHFPMAPGMFIGATVMPWEGSEDAVKPPWIPGVIVKRYRLIKFPLAGMISSRTHPRVRVQFCMSLLFTICSVMPLFKNSLMPCIELHSCSYDVECAW